MKDKFTVKEIEDAWCGTVGDLKKTIAELTRPEPEFSEGEVVAWTDGEGKQCYRRYNTSPNCFFNMAKQDFDHRPLTLTEHGKHVRDLRSIADKIYTYIDGGGAVDSSDDFYADLRDTLNRFDAAVKDE